MQLKRVMESDAAMIEDLIAYNIIPLDGPSKTNAIGSFPEVSWSTFISGLYLLFALFLNPKNLCTGSRSHIGIKIL